MFYLSKNRILYYCVASLVWMVVMVLVLMVLLLVLLLLVVLVPLKQNLFIINSCSTGQVNVTISSLCSVFGWKGDMTQFQIECRTGGQNMTYFRFFSCRGPHYFTGCHTFLRLL